MDPKVWFLGPLDRIIYLHTLPALEGLRPSHLATIAQHARERFFTSGSVLLHPGEPAPALHIVVDGSVTVNRPGRPSQSIGPREAVGFLHLLARDRTGLEARARMDTVTLELDSDLQLAVCQEHFSILRHYLAYLCTQSIEIRGDPTTVIQEKSEGAGQENHSSQPLDLIQRLLALRQLEAFSPTDLDALAELARQATELRFENGQQIWPVGERSDHFLLPLSGSLICRSDTSQQTWPIFPGQPAGLDEALAHLPRWYQAAAQGNVLALQIMIDPFLDILEDHFEMSMDLVSTLALQLIELQEERARQASVD